MCVCVCEREREREREIEIQSEVTRVIVCEWVWACERQGDRVVQHLVVRALSSHSGGGGQEGEGEKQRGGESE